MSSSTTSMVGHLSAMSMQRVSCVGKRGPHLSKVLPSSSKWWDNIPPMLYKNKNKKSLKKLMVFCSSKGVYNIVLWKQKISYLISFIFLIYLYCPFVSKIIVKIMYLFFKSCSSLHFIFKNWKPKPNLKYIFHF